MGAFLRKYGTGSGADVIIPMIKRGVVDYAVSADWTPAAGDVKVSKDGGAEANIGTLPVINGTTGWKFVFADAELQCKSLTVRIVDSATKVVEDQFFIIETYGHASAMYQADLSAANLPANVTQWRGSTPANLADTDKIPASAQHVANNVITAAGINDGAFTAAKFASGAFSAIAAAVWEVATSGLSTAGSIGKAFLDNWSTLLSTRFTSARAGYLDNLNVGGLVASQADVAAITQAQRVRLVLPASIERPDSGSTTYRLYIFAYNEQHEAEDLDEAPTVTVENNAGTDRSSGLGTVTKPGATTGQYYVDYTVADSHAIEGLLFKVDAVEGGETTRYAIASLVVDTTAVDFTAADRTKLEAIHGKLPSKSYLTGTANSDGDIELNESTGDFNATQQTRIQTQAAAALTAYDPPTRAEATSDKQEIITAVGDPFQADDYTAPDNAGVAATKAVTDKLDTALELDGDVYRLTTNAVENVSKNGYKLASDGLDQVSTTEPDGLASDFREMVVQTWRRWFKKSTLTSSQLKTYKDDGSAATTQTVSESSGTQTVEDAA